MSAQRHHKMVDQYVSQHLPETTIDWGCVYVDMAQQDLSCLTMVKQCKHEVPKYERKEKRLSRALISDQCVCLNPTFVHHCRWQ